MSLPVESIVAPLLSGIRQHDVILVAPPGAGKSTCLPLKLLAAEQFSAQRIIMLQPRRVAVRAIADYLAKQLGESVGETIGYRIRGEQKVSRSTRLEIVTEGLLTRMIQSDPELSGIGLIIFDEFHERNLHADFSLALTRECQQALRDDLRVLVMSATLDIEPVKRVLPEAIVLQSEGRSFPVDIRYRPVAAQSTLVDAVVSTLREALYEHEGNVLAFLPGSGAIRTVESRLRPHFDDGVEILPLYGSLDKSRQQRAISPVAEGRRKVVLATNIAETSLTIDGISVVVDSGQEKVATFDLKRGITQLRSQYISQASSVQRAGRAGRVQAGVCYRLWAQDIQSRLAKQPVPQILQTDIAPFFMEAALWGCELEGLPLVDKPTDAQLAQAESLLQTLGAIDEQAKLTPLGQRMAALGCHPRLASMLIKSQERNDGDVSLACVLTALLESPDGRQLKNASLVNAVQSIIRQPSHPVIKQARSWAKRLNTQFVLPEEIDHHALVALIACAYPDFIAKSRGQGRFLLANGTGASVNEDDSLSHAEWLVVADLMLTDRAEARVSLAESVSPESVQQVFSHLITRQVECRWDEPLQKIVARDVTRLGAIELDSRPVSQVDSQQRQHMWLTMLKLRGLELLGSQPAIEALQQKLKLARAHLGDDWPLLDEARLVRCADEWFEPYVADMLSIKMLRQHRWSDAIRNLLSWDQQQQLQALFPSHLTVPSGNRHKLTYRDDGVVVLSVRMQEMYGLSETPSIANGRLPILIELLSPAQRPIQTTNDLAGFWRGSYKDVQKDMKGRYPKHFWPDNPAEAPATTRTKKNM